MQSRLVQSRLRLAGQAVQPLLLMFPLGLFALALIFDAASLLGGPHLLGTLAFWNLAAGLLGGTVATLPSGYETVGARNSASARIAVLSLLIDVGVLLLFAVIALTRLRAPDRNAGPSLLLIEVMGLALVVFGTWYGGRFGDPASPMNRPVAPAHQRRERVSKRPVSKRPVSKHRAGAVRPRTPAVAVPVPAVRQPPAVPQRRRAVHQS